MAVVTLRVGESATVAGVTVRILGVRCPGEVRLAIEAPAGTKVWRGAADRFNPDQEPTEPPGAA